MNKKRDRISEIIEKRDRLPKTERFELLFKRVMSLIKSEAYIASKIKEKDIRKELFRYLPTAYVACIEHYYRLVIKDLIDNNENYAKNAANLENKSISIKDIVAMQGKKVTVGDFVAHTLSFNNMADIKNNISQIIGEDYISKLGNTNCGLPKMEDITLNKYDSKWYLRLQKLFELRHIYCHELSEKPKIDGVLLEQMANVAVLFFIASETFIFSLLERTQK